MCGDGSGEDDRKLKIVSAEGACQEGVKQGPVESWRHTSIQCVIRGCGPRLRSGPSIFALLADIKIKAEGNALNYGIPYSNLRYHGAIVQIYINGAFGKDQWVAMPFLRGVFLMSNSIHLPIDEWVEDGFPVGKYVRVVIINSE